MSKFCIDALNRMLQIIKKSILVMMDCFIGYYFLTIVAEAETGEVICKTCSKSFRNRRMLRWHIDYEHSKKVKCRQCGFMAKSQAIMR